MARLPEGKVGHKKCGRWVQSKPKGKTTGGPVEGEAVTTV
jgi:hypothetical protein